MTRSTKVCIPNSDEQNTNTRLFLHQQFFQIGMTPTQMIEEKTESEKEEEDMLKSENELRDLASIDLTLDDSSQNEFDSNSLIGTDLSSDGLSMANLPAPMFMRRSESRSSDSQGQFSDSFSDANIEEMHEYQFQNEEQPQVIRREQSNPQHQIS